MSVLVIVPEKASQNLTLAPLSWYILINRQLSWRKVRLNNKSHREKHYEKPHTFNVDTEWNAVFTLRHCIGTPANEHADRQGQGKPGQEDQPGWEAVLIKYYYLWSLKLEVPHSCGYVQLSIYHWDLYLTKLLHSTC